MARAFKGEDDALWSERTKLFAPMPSQNFIRYTFYETKICCGCLPVNYTFCHKLNELVMEKVIFIDDYDLKT